MHKKLLKLFELAEEQGIIVDFSTLPQKHLGLYMKEPGMDPIITLDKSIENNEKKLLEVFAEELGHHFTTTGEFVGPFFHYSNRLILNKVEEKAMRWATEYLIPLDELMEILRIGISSINNLVEKLELPREIVMKRLEFLSKRYDMLRIDDNKSLVLSTYPNVFVYGNI